jgi:hypothetical protein
MGVAEPPAYRACRAIVGPTHCLLDRAHVASKKHTHIRTLDIQSSVLKYKYIVLLYIGWVKWNLVCR